MTDPQSATPEEFLALLQSQMPKVRAIPPETLIEYTKGAKFREIIQTGLWSPPSEGGSEFIEKSVQEWTDRIKKVSAEKPMENPFWDGILDDLTKEVLQVLEENKIALPQKIVIGSLATGEVNAISIRVPRGGYIVALNSGLFMFIFLFAKAITSFIPVKGLGEQLTFSVAPQDVQKALETNIEGHRRFLEVTSAYVLLGDASLAPAYLQQGPQKVLTELLTDTAELFVVAHEYSHVILGHVSASESNRGLVETMETTELIWSWSDEVRADEFGADLTIAVNRSKGLDVALSYAGIELFLACVDLVQKAEGKDSHSSLSESEVEFVSSAIEEKLPDATPAQRQLTRELVIAQLLHDAKGMRIPDHPSIGLRRALLREYLRSRVGEQATGAIDLGERLDEIASSLWKRNCEAFTGMRSELVKAESRSKSQS